MSHAGRRTARGFKRARKFDEHCQEHGGARVHRSYDAATHHCSPDDPPWWCPESGGYHAGSYGRDAWRFDCQDTA